MNYNVENCGRMMVYQRRRFHDGRAQPVAKKEEQSCPRPLEVVEVGNEKEHLCLKPRYQREANLGDELIEIDREQFYHKKRDRHRNVERRDLVIRKCAHVHIDNEQLHLSSAVARAGVVRVGDKSKAKHARKRNSVVEKEDEKPNLRSKRMKECISERRSENDERDLAVVKFEEKTVKKELEAKVKIENENADVRAINNLIKTELMDLVKYEDGRLSSKKIAAVKDEPDDGTSTGSADVEILDIAPLVERGISCPFVTSKKFHKSMVEDEYVELGPSATDKFREDVLRVLRKPFDRKEYRKYREEIKAGS